MIATRSRSPAAPRVSSIDEAAPVRHLARRTEKAYRGWARRFVVANAWRHPRSLGRSEAEAFLSDLATRGKVSASTQNQALAALLFLFRAVLGQDRPWLDGLIRAPQRRRVPVVLTRAEVRSLLSELNGTPRVIATLLYGAGVRLLEAMGLRVQDADLETHVLTIRSGKGDRDRRAILPTTLRMALADQIRKSLDQHERDLEECAGWVDLPHVLGRQYQNAGRTPGWQWVFPATFIYRDPDSGEWRRHHLHETVIQRAVREAVHRAGIQKRATCRTLRHSFATHLLEDG